MEREGGSFKYTDEQTDLNCRRRKAGSPRSITPKSVIRESVSARAVVPEHKAGTGPRAAATHSQGRVVAVPEEVSEATLWKLQTEARARRVKSAPWNSAKMQNGPWVEPNEACQVSSRPGTADTHFE